MAHASANRLVYEAHDKALHKAASAYVKGELIDIGCGIKPYKDMMAGLVSKHVGVDHKQSLHDQSQVDLFGTAYEIPVGGAAFDSAICTCVLEHLEEPELAIRECFRVLRKSGVAIYTVPFIWHLHEQPRDFYRFSKYSLEYLFKKVGFEVIEIQPLLGFWGTFGQLLVYNLYRFHKGLCKKLRVIEAAGWVIQKVAGFLDRVDKTEEWPCLYLIAARKP